MILVEELRGNRRRVLLQVTSVSGASFHSFAMCSPRTCLGNRDQMNVIERQTFFLSSSSCRWLGLRLRTARTIDWSKNGCLTAGLEMKNESATRVAVIIQRGSNSVSRVLFSRLGAKRMRSNGIRHQSDGHRFTLKTGKRDRMSSTSRALRMRCVIDLSRT